MVRRLLLLFTLFVCFATSNAKQIMPLLEDENPVHSGGPSFNITPNPVSGSYFYVNLDFLESDFPDAAIIISDVLGKVAYVHPLKKSDYMEKQVRINVMDANLDKGVYFLQVKSGEHTRTLKLAIR